MTEIPSTRAEPGQGGQAAAGIRAQVTCSSEVFKGADPVTWVRPMRRAAPMIPDSIRRPAGRHARPAPDSGRLAGVTSDRSRSNGPDRQCDSARAKAGSAKGAHK